MIWSHNPLHHYNSDPTGAAEIWKEKLAMSVEQFMARKISDDVFRADLYALHFRGEILRWEFNYHHTNRVDQERAKHVKQFGRRPPLSETP